MALCTAVSSKLIKCQFSRVRFVSSFRLRMRKRGFPLPTLTLTLLTLTLTLLPTPCTPTPWFTPHSAPTTTHASPATSGAYGTAFVLCPPSTLLTRCLPSLDGISPVSGGGPGGGVWGGGPRGSCGVVGPSDGTPVYALATCADMASVGMALNSSDVLLSSWIPHSGVNGDNVLGPGQNVFACGGSALLIQCSCSSPTDGCSSFDVGHPDRVFPLSAKTNAHHATRCVLPEASGVRAIGLCLATDACTLAPPACGPNEVCVPSPISPFSTASCRCAPGFVRSNGTAASPCVSRVVPATGPSGCVTSQHHQPFDLLEGIGWGAIPMVGDVDQDGRDDVVLSVPFPYEGAGGGSNLMVFINTGTHSPDFAGPETRLWYDPTRMVSVDTGYMRTADGAELIDVDGDGDLDIMGGWHDLVFWVANEPGAPGATSAPGYFDPDVRFIEVPRDLAGTTMSCVAIADYDGDGVLDVATTFRFDDLAWLLYMASPTSLDTRVPVYNTSLVTPGNGPWSVEALDLNNDNRPDLLMSGWASAILLNSASGRGFQDPIPLDYGAEALILSELDNDGNMDVVASGAFRSVVYGTSSLPFWETGAPDEVPLSQAFVKTRWSAVLDWDQDTWPDLFDSPYSPGGRSIIRTWRNKGASRSFGPPSVLGGRTLGREDEITYVRPLALHIGGSPSAPPLDAVASSRVGFLLYTLDVPSGYAASDVAFASGHLITPYGIKEDDPGPSAMAVADVDRDGVWDVVVGYDDAAGAGLVTSSTFLNGGNGMFDTATALDPAAAASDSYHSVWALDSCGGGNVVAVTSTTVWMARGDAATGELVNHTTLHTWATPLSPGTGMGMKVVCGVDVDGDGSRDVAVTGAEEGALILGAGGAAAGRSVVPEVGVRVVAMGAGDRVLVLALDSGGLYDVDIRETEVVSAGVGAASAWTMGTVGAIAVGDVTGNGEQRDVLVGGQGGVALFVRPSDETTIGNVSPVWVTQDVSAVALALSVADEFGYAHPSVVIGTGTDSLAFVPQLSALGFGSTYVFWKDVGRDLVGMGLYDLDVDGVRDVVFASRGNGTGYAGYVSFSRCGSYALSPPPSTPPPSPTPPPSSSSSSSWFDNIVILVVIGGGSLCICFGVSILLFSLCRHRLSQRVAPHTDRLSSDRHSGKEGGELVEWSSSSSSLLSSHHTNEGSASDV